MSELNKHRYHPDSVYYKCIPIPDDDLTKSIVLNNVCNQLFFNHTRTAKRYLNRLQKQDSLKADYYLASTIYFMVKNNYDLAHENMQHLKPLDFPFLQKFLKIDITYEMEKWQNAYNFETYLQQYQNLLDEYNQDVLIRNIIVNRVRNARYRI